MKDIKKLLSIVMVLAMVLALGAQAFAATVTITQPEGGATHTYTAYQIFKGTQNDESGNQLGTVEWGKDINGEVFLAALKKATITGMDFSKCEDAADVSEVLNKYKTGTQLNDESLRAFGSLALEYMTGNSGSTTEAFEGLDNGYYVFKDTTSDDVLDAANDVRNDVILQVTEDITIAFKNEKPSSEKKVKDINDSTGDGGSWEDSADHDVNDTVEYLLKADVKDLTRYEKYYLQFVDNISKGLTYNGDAKVYLGNPYDEEDDTDVTSHFTTGTETAKDGYANAYTWTCDDVTAFTTEDDVTIYILYTCTLNGDAVIGNPGNPNEMHIEFSRDPNSDEKGETPDDKVVVFTYDLDVNKVNEKNEPLEGAEFKLYKEIKNHVEGDSAVQLTEDGSVADESHPAKDASKWYVEVTLSVTAGPEGKNNVFTAERIDDGNYAIVETVAPAGYNKAAPIKFTLTATHSEEKTGVTSPADESFTVTMTPGENEAIIDTNVENRTGLELPETGGIGTTIFYVVGGVLVAAAVILLVTKRRVSEK